MVIRDLVFIKIIFLSLLFGMLFFGDFILHDKVTIASNTKNIRSPVIVGEESKTETFELRNGEEILIEIYTEFELRKLKERERKYRYISANSCASARTFRLILDEEPEKIIDVLNEKYNKLVKETIACMEELFNVEVSKLVIKYKQVKHIK